MNYLFDWDSKKAIANFIKHKVKFDSAVSVFRDPQSITIFDNEHSEYDERWITIGLSINSQLIVVVHTFQELDSENALIRIISARKATKTEIKYYKGE
jgi:uncharacterized DUF497 family protein